MSVSVLRNSREQPPLVAAVDCGGANLNHGNGDGGGGKTSAASASPRAVALAVASAAVASHSEEERTSGASLNNNLERKGINQLPEPVRVDEAAQHQPPPPQPTNSVGIPVTRNFKTSANTSTDVRAVARRAYAPKSAGFGPALFNRQQIQSGYRPRRRVHSVSEDDGNVTTRPDIFNASFPKRSRFPAKTQSTYQFQQQKSTFTGNSANGGYRRTGETRFPKRARSGTNPLLNQPPAPNNTTQFLITDHEEREDLLPSTSSAETGVGMDDATTAQPANAINAAADDHPMNAASNEEPCSSSGHRRRSSDTVDFDEEFIEDPEFAAVCDDYNLERIMSMSRDEVNREMLETQKDNLHLSEKVEILRSDNLRLRAMLRDCGYEDVSAPASLGTAAIFPASLRKSTSPDTTLIHLDDEADPTTPANSTAETEDP